MTIPLIYDADVDAEAVRRVGVSAVGGKAANLWRLVHRGAAVPPFFVLTTEAFRTAMHAAGITDDIRRRAKSLAATAASDAVGDVVRSIRDAIVRIPLPPDLIETIRAAHRRLAEANSHENVGSSPTGEALLVAVRSSAADEDAAGRSFAGMHDSFLFVRGEDGVLDAIRRVWASAYNERAVAYRRSQGLSLDGIAVAVVVQRMIDASRSGVMFTCHPATNSPHQVVISSLYGAGEGLVSAGLDADTYAVDKHTLAISPEIAVKSRQFVFDETAGAGLQDVAVPENLRSQSSLSDDEVREVARHGMEIERRFGRPQDVEFSFDRRGKLYLLQTRPVTNVAEYGPAAGNPVVWDNSNIIESYSGATTPMTFSFIRRAYTIVYHSFSRVMGISPRTVHANRGTFENMLGLFRGRVYYNLRNWYRLIRLFPGYQYNRRFMESMMGLKEPLGDADDVVPPAGRLRRWFVELPALVRLLVRSSWNFWRIETIVRRFEDNFHRHYDRWARLDISSHAPHELKRLYHEMEDALLWDWKAPIINDFYVMIYYGLLKKLCTAWLGDASGGLQNDLICGEGGVESAEPAKMLLRMAKIAQDDAELRRMLLEEPLDELPARIRTAADAARVADAGGAADDRGAVVRFQRSLEEYLDRFGFRCMNELKLEEYSLRDRPQLVFQAIRNYLALDDPAALDVEAMGHRERRVRREAEERAADALSTSRGVAPRRWIFRRVLANARRGVKNRENMRFARTRIYGLVRELLRAIGRQFADEGVLADAEDIFYLTIDEVWDYIQGTAVTVRLRELAAVRRAEFNEYRAETTPPPDDRFETYGMAYHKNLFRNHRPRTPATVDGKLRGTGCSPGVVTGTVKVLRTPSDNARLSREILVAERTDPGWVPLYPAVSGILIERGSILSHSAVVAREMGIPTIVGIVGLLATIHSGDRVTMDGAAGTVEVEEK